MSLDQNQIAQDLAQAIASINAAQDLEALKQVKIDYVGDKSPLAKANQALATVDKSLRAEFGKIIGSAKAELNEVFESGLRSYLANATRRYCSQKELMSHYRCKKHLKVVYIP